jgi:hypothetical protein
VHRLTDAPSQLRRRGRGQHIANSIWGLAEVGARTSKLVAAINQIAKVFFFAAECQHVSMTVRSMGVMGLKAPLLAAEIEENAEAFVVTMQAIPSRKMV